MTTTSIPSRRWTADELAGGARYALITSAAAEDAMMSYAVFGGWIAADAPIMGQTADHLIRALRSEAAQDDADRDDVADYLISRCAVGDQIRYLAAVPAAVASVPGKRVSREIVEIIAAL